MNKFNKMFIVTICSLLIFSSCMSESNDSIKGTENNNTSLNTELMNEEYLKILNNYSESIKLGTQPGEFGYYYLTDKNGNPSERTVSFCDITGDGLDEMFFVEYKKIEGAYQYIPHIYTFIDDKVVEMNVKNNTSARGEYETNHLFNSVAIAGEGNLNYLVFIDDNLNIYSIDRSQDANDDYFITVYHADKKGNIAQIKEIDNLYDSMDKTDEYYIDGEKVDNNTGTNEFKKLKALYKNTILYNGKLEDLSVMEKVSDSTNLSMPLDDAIEHLR